MTLPVVTLHRGRARPFWSGNPILFSGAVAEVTGDPGGGDLVEVCDRDGKPIGQGFFNPSSSYRVRLVRLQREEDLPLDPEGIITARIATAAALRKGLGLPTAATNAYRLVNSEGDYLSGLTVDLFDRTAVVMASALWVERYRDTVFSAIRSLVGVDTQLVYRVSNAVRREEAMSAAPEADPCDPVEILEYDLRFAVDAQKGQKTGFYLDQRHNRLRVRHLAKDRSVLDLYCFSGGFGLNAMRGGARQVRCVDSSEPAIRLARDNAARNGFEGISFEVGDVVDVLSQSERFDMVVCDPPKFAGTRHDLDAALTRYARLNHGAMLLLNPGGILVTCSCSGVVRRDDFIAVVRDAAAQAGRRVAIIGVHGAAPDHVLNPAYPEGEYLKCVIGVVS